jgi:hypothetical protein
MGRRQTRLFRDTTVRRARPSVIAGKGLNNFKDQKRPGLKEVLAIRVMHKIVRYRGATASVSAPASALAWAPERVLV